MDVGPLRSFVAVAREAHLTRAAIGLGLTQPAVSGHVARLEEELGTALFHRSAKGMVLTDAGSVFLEHAERALLALSDGVAAVAELQGVQRGALSVGGGATATTYLMPRLLSTFHQRFPDVRLYVREAGSRAVVDAVLSGELDLGVVTVSDEPSTRLTVRPWVADELVLIVPDGHRLAHRSTFHWAELHHQPLVLFEAGSAVRRRIDGAMEAYGVSPHIVMELRSIESIQQMVAQGIGAAFVSRFALGEGGRFLTPHEGGERLRRMLAVVRRADRRPSPAARAFLAMMSDETSAP
jgi:LysR family cyn operon transcriptional activator